VTHREGPVYKSCAAALGTIGTPEAIAALERGFEQGDRKIRREIKSVLAGNFPRWKDEDRSQMPADSRLDAAEIRPHELE
jgi:HEAT repeat protein